MDSLALLLGKPLVVDGITVRHPKVSDLISIGEEKYVSIINIFMLRPSDMMVELYDVGIDFSKTSPFELFILLCGETTSITEDGTFIFNKKSEISKGIGWLTGVYDFCISYEEDICLRSKETSLVINEEVYGKIRKFLFDIHFREDKEKYNPANETTVKFLVGEERRKNKRRRNKKQRGSFSSIISSLVWIGGKSFDEISSMYMYQIHDGISRIDKNKDFDGISFGFYSGNITKKDYENIFDEINWKN